MRNAREEQNGFENLPEVWDKLKRNYRDDWLCALEILEVLNDHKQMPELAKDIRIQLELKAGNQPEDAKLIHNGLSLL